MLGQVRIAARMLAKTPAFTAIAVLALALGIGASTTVFSAVNALLIRPWPNMTDQERIVYFSQYFAKQGKEDAGLAYPDFVEFKAQASSFEGMAASEDVTFILTGGETPQRYLG